MKTIVLKSGNISLFLVGDGMTIDTSGEKISWGAGGMNANTIGDIPTADLTVHSNVTEVRSDVEYLKGTSVKREDWVGREYSYDGTDWVEL